MNNKKAKNFRKMAIELAIADGNFNITKNQPTRYNFRKMVFKDDAKTPTLMPLTVDPTCFRGYYHEVKNAAKQYCYS